MIDMTQDNLEHRIDEGEREMFERLQQIQDTESSSSGGTIPEFIEHEYTIKSGTYDVDHHILVHEKGTLIIEKGTVLNFDKDIGLFIGTRMEKGGTLHVDGTADEPVIMKKKDDSWNSEWYGITIEHSLNGNLLSNVNIKGAKKEQGGGIYIHQSKLRLENGTINYCEARQGGGMYNEDSEVEVYTSNIHDNKSDVGGGIYHNGSVLKAINSNISSNNAQNGGGGIFISNAKGELGHCNISKNDAESWGGAGICTENSRVKISFSQITENKTEGWGGGLSATHRSYIELEGVNIEKNKAHFGGGMNIDESTVEDISILSRSSILNNITSDPFHISNNIFGEHVSGRYIERWNKTI